jgi:hypothetical protein
MSCDPVTLFCRKFNISENVYRACARAGVFTLKTYLSRYHSNATEDFPLPTSEAREPEPTPAPPQKEIANAREASKSAERPEWRVARILTAPEAAGRQCAAEFIAKRTSLDVQTARSLLASLPYEPLLNLSSDSGTALVRTNPADAFPPGSAMARRSQNPWAHVLREVNGSIPPGAVTSRELVNNRQ